MKNSNLINRYKSLNAEFSDCYNWQLPRSFTTVAEEYTAARNTVALMERPYFGVLKVSGKDHLDLLHRLTTNELRNLTTGEGQINIFTDQKGRIVDRCIFYKLLDAIWLITSPGNSEKVAAWIEKYTFIEDVTVEDCTSEFGIVSLFGPKSAALLTTLFGNELQLLSVHHHRERAFENHTVRISKSAELAVPGFDLMAQFEILPGLWETVRAKGGEFGLTPMGEEAFEILRIENGWPVYGKDFDATINPHEAQMRPYINFDKGCYIGQEVIARLDTYEKVQKYLTGIALAGDTLPTVKDAVLINGEEVGYVTSVTRSLSLNQNLALGYVRTRHIRDAARVVVKSNGREIPGKLIKLPFEVV